MTTVRNVERCVRGSWVKWRSRIGMEDGAGLAMYFNCVLYFYFGLIFYAFFYRVFLLFIASRYCKYYDCV